MKTIFILILSLAVLLTGCTPAAAPLPTQTPTVERSSIQYPQTGPIIRLSYDPAMTGPVEAGHSEAVSNRPDLPYPLIHPGFVQLRFPGFAKGQTFQLPFPIEGPQMLAYRTQDFAGYENEGSRSYPQQLSQLKALLEKGIDPGHCAQPLAGDEQALPFLPLVNAAQVFCAKAHPVTFNGGKGIRYITYYAQGIDPASELFVFYTFQGLTEDGQYYLSAILPIRTNILPDKPPVLGANPNLKAQEIILRDQNSKINAQAEDGFTPSISVLDALVSGVKIPGN